MLTVVQNNLRQIFDTFAIGAIIRTVIRTRNLQEAINGI